MIGLIFGDSDFPKKILNRIIKLKKKYFIIDFSKNRKFKYNRNSYAISIGQFGKVINLIKEKNCKKVLFAGKIDKPRLSNIKLDLKGIYYIPRIIKASKIGDAAILKMIIKILSKEKIRVISSIYFNPELSLSKGVYTKCKPNKNDLRSIKYGIKSLEKLNPHNHIQALVVKGDNIIAKETAKGTKKMLQQINKCKKSERILIKFPKKKQDIRLDLPTVGLDTLKDCKRVGINGIVLKSKKNIFLDKRKSISFANKNNIFITVK